MSIEKDIHVLVYGTLRRGGENHALLEQAVYEQTIRIGGFTMVSINDRLPAIFEDKTGMGAICEHYRLDQQAFKQLDEMRREPKFISKKPITYARKQVSIYTPKHIEPIDAWLYYMDSSELKNALPVSGGDWVRFSH